ncbi:hypothetical protein DUD99_00040 [Salmonella enterica subsp. enterica]|uniref:Uncharacterized protein n=2 Tax=Salmonella enterica I TaxID=59201 RepID=A0A657FK60_SALET|nr:hypothetical protein [Salmonella enterica]EAC2141201.1 hypothetical protein [Salmonella enterica subsp. enterica]EBZ5927100.1 hypothetical protein [Salmonella enterica subsp. enterica serovar Weslaco]EBZ6046348.1 hypothetical protein [Salmonella enterica subsp. enterica serovar Texas]ECS6013856.1 hypothetical protein [Salmonella enterica subsp. enterica serovar Rough O:k:1,5]ECS7543104.1 hypothetical protein [Salmonella enterica subsp. enterica serovar Denver]
MQKYLTLYTHRHRIGWLRAFNRSIYVILSELSLLPLNATSYSVGINRQYSCNAIYFQGNN